MLAVMPVKSGLRSYGGLQLNDCLLAQAVAAHDDYMKSKFQKKGKHLPSYISHLTYRITSYISEYIFHQP